MPRRWDEQAVQPIDRLARSREREALVTPRQRTERPFATATRIALSRRRSECVNKKSRKRENEERARRARRLIVDATAKNVVVSARAARVRRGAPRLSRDAPRRETPAGLATTPRPATPSPCSSPKAPQVAIASQTAMTPPRCHRVAKSQAIRRAGPRGTIDASRVELFNCVGSSSARNRSRPQSSQGSRTTN